jgi:hypothetical protein
VYSDGKSATPPVFHTELGPMWPGRARAGTGERALDFQRRWKLNARMVRSRSRGARLAVREARLITKELRHLGVPPQTIAKIWGAVIGIPIVLVLGYLALNYDSGTADPSILNGVQMMYKDAYQSQVKNNTAITLKSLTMTCLTGGDAQPVTSIAGLYPPLQPGYGEDVYISGNCRLIRVNESHQLW